MKSGKHRSVASREDTSRRHESKTARSNVVTSQDYEELKKHYKFVLPEEKKDEKKRKSSGGSTNTTWQERMVKKYHDHLYKEFAIVDLSVPGRIGLRFRIKQEVVAGKGYNTCGNVGCPSFQNPELYKQSTRDRHLTQGRLQLVAPADDGSNGNSGVGEGLCDYEVPFQYVEQKETKMELVKLRLCLACAPLLLERSGSAKRVKKGAKRSKANDDTDESSSESSSSSSEESTDSSDNSYRKRKSRRRHRKRKKSKRGDADGELTKDGSTRKSSSGRRKDQDASETDDDSSRERSHKRRRRKESRKRKRKRRKEKR